MIDSGSATLLDICTRHVGSDRYVEVMNAVEKFLIEKTLIECHFNYTHAAITLGISRKKLHRLRVKYSIECRGNL